MIWYKFISINLLKIYKYIYKFRWLVKKHSWIQFLNSIKTIFYINNNRKVYSIQYVLNKVVYFFLNYNVNFRIKKGKMRYLIFIKKYLFLPNLHNISKISSYLVSLNYKKNFYKQILYWYYNAVRPIKFNYNYNDLLKFFNSVINLIEVYFFYLNLLTKRFLLYRFLRFKLFYKIKNLFNFIFLQCLKRFKYFKNIKYFFFSFIVKRKKKNILLLKKNTFLLRKNFNILLLFNKILKFLVLFLIKNWLDLNLLFLLKNINNFYNYKNYLYFFNKKIYNFLYIKYKIAWKLLFKITYVNYFKPNNFIINYKKGYFL